MKINVEVKMQEKSELASDPLIGDVIGDTVYSQRFVLKILLKFANLDTYKEEVYDDDFETDMCTLWDMTTERDVVDFLLDNDVYNLFQFVLPTTSNVRIVEIIIGIMGNLCCTAPSVARLIDNKDLCLTLLTYIKTDDTLVLLQVMRFINACLVNQKDDDLLLWLNIFRESDVPHAISFILKYSANKQVLMSTLETLHCICLSCNIETLQHIFFELFVQENMLECLIVAFWELQKLNKNESFETINSYYTMYLYVTMTLAGFNKSIATYSNHLSATLNTLIATLKYYTNKVTRGYLKDTSADVVEHITIICSSLCVYSELSMRQLLHYMFTLWQCSPPDDDHKNTGLSNNLTTKLNENVCIFFGKYMGSVTDEALKLHISSDMKLKICAILNNMKKYNYTSTNINELEIRVKVLCSPDHI